MLLFFGSFLSELLKLGLLGFDFAFIDTIEDSLVLKHLHRLFELANLLCFEHSFVQSVDFGSLQRGNSLYLVIGKQVLQESTDLLDHTEWQELVNVTVRRLDLVVQILATVFETRLLQVDFDLELLEVCKRGALLSLAIDLSLDVHKFITEHALKAAVTINSNAILSQVFV